MNANANDALIAALGIGALIALRSAPARGVLVGLAAAAKFGPAALAPLFATGRRRAALARRADLLGRVRARRASPRSSRSSPTAACARCTTARSATRRRAARRSASGARRRRSTGCSRWRGLLPPALAIGVAFWPRHKTPVQVAALAAAVTIAVQLTAGHWFYFYVVWFLPFGSCDFGPAHRVLASTRRLEHAIGAIVRSSPSCGELTTTSSPGCSQTLGSRAPPTPDGRPGGDDVARLEGHQGRQVGDDLGDREDQPGGRVLLHALAVQVERDPDRVVRPGLVGRDDRRPARARRRRRPCPASTAASRTAGRAPRGR